MRRNLPLPFINKFVLLIKSYAPLKLFEFLKILIELQLYFESKSDHWFHTIMKYVFESTFYLTIFQNKCTYK